MKITKRQLRRIIKEEKAKLVREFKANELEIELYLKDIADSGRRDGLSPGSIKMMLQDEFMDNFGSYENIMDYEGMIDGISKGLMESTLNERGTGNPALAEEIPEEDTVKDTDYKKLAWKKAEHRGHKEHDILDKAQNFLIEKKKIFKQRKND